MKIFLPDNISIDEAFEFDSKQVRESMELVATIDLTNILIKEMLKLNESPLLTSDAISGDLLVVVYELSTDQGPLSSEYSDPYQNIILINDIKLQGKYENPSIAKQIIANIPSLVWKYFNQQTEILAYINSPSNNYVSKLFEDSGFKQSNDSDVYYSYVL